jgi:hypothetical protein
MKQYLSAAQVAELAELLEEAPVRVGVIDEVLQAAADRRGMTLVLTDVQSERRGGQTSGSDAAGGPNPLSRGGGGVPTRRGR